MSGLLLAFLAFLALQVGVPRAAAAGECANEAIRLMQGSTYLPDCRAYEMVSPSFKGYSDIVQTSSRIRSSLDGDTVTYVSMGAFAGAEGTGALVQYLSRRTANGWTTTSITPPQRTGVGTLGKATMFFDFSDDLGAGIMRATDPVLAPSEPSAADTQHLFVRDNITGGLSLVTPTSVAPVGQEHIYSYEPIYAGASRDFRHVLFESKAALTSNAPDDGTVKLYESVDGSIRLAGVLQDGTAAPGGSFAGAGAASYVAGAPVSAALGYRAVRTTGAISDDGEVVYFTSGPFHASASTAARQIYARLSGTTTIHVSRSQRSEPDPAGTKAAIFQIGSSDGSGLYFTSTEKLLDGDLNTSADLYRYNLEGDSLTLVSLDGEPADGMSASVQGVLGASEDGATVYFAASGQLTPEAAGIAGTKLYRWREGVTTFVAQLHGADSRLWRPEYGVRRDVRVSPDGNAILFATFQSLSGYDNGGFQGQLYLWRDGDAAPACISCLPPGSASVEARLTESAAVNAAGRIEYEARSLADDGTAYFMTGSSLLPEDVNGTIDAYQYDPDSAKLSLISTGAGDSDAYFGDTSADGEDVFVLTRDRLSPLDRDDNLDLYDARVGAEPDMTPVPVAPACDGDECQGAPGSQPAFATPASSALTGPPSPRKARGHSTSCARKSRRAHRTSKSPAKARAERPKRCRASARKKQAKASRGAAR